MTLMNYLTYFVEIAANDEDEVLHQLQINEEHFTFYLDQTAKRKFRAINRVEKLTVSDVAF